MSQDSNNGGGMAARAAQLAQLARGVAETIRGAMAGGLYGAAVAAAKAFAPQIIKIVAAIILALLILPTIIFFALPNMLWQWPSSNDAEITTMNLQAQYIDDLYKKLEGFALEEADKIVESLSTGYDDVVVSMDLGGVSRNWLIAINSVMNEQEMGRIDETRSRWRLRPYKRSLSHPQCRWQCLPQVFDDRMLYAALHNRIYLS